MRKQEKIPEFKNEAEEREFWETHDSSNHVDWSQAGWGGPTRLHDGT